MEEKDYTLKMDGEKDSFDGGAIRYTKTGKGRFDLIPGVVVNHVLDYAKGVFESGSDIHFSKTETLEDAYSDGLDRYYNTIVNVTALSFSDEAHILSYKDFVEAFLKMLHALAIHYEKGAFAYGVDNWKKGIPVIGGDRGGSFTDSMLRHLNQFLSGETDERHDVAAIWNAFGALYYTINNL